MNNKGGLVNHIGEELGDGVGLQPRRAFNENNQSLAEN